MIIELDIMTIIYFCILAFVIPVLICIGYRIGSSIANSILVKYNRRVLSGNQKLLRENMESLNKFMVKLDELNIKLRGMNEDNIK